MKRIRAVALAAALLTTALASGQAAPAPAQTSPKTAPAAPASIGKILDGQLKQVESELVPAVEAMPDDKFDFAPTAGEFKTVRTFALQARHVATTNYWLYAALTGQKTPVEMGKDENGADTLKSKADIVNYLKGSYAFAHKALASVADDQWTSEISSPFNPKAKTTPLALSVLLQGHQFDHYGQMVEYLRMNGIVPPASRPRQ